MAGDGTARRGSKKCRKYDRNARRPAHARRKLHRPDLHRKARNVRRHGGDVRAWAAAAVARGESILVVAPIRDAELARA